MLVVIWDGWAMLCVMLMVVGGLALMRLTMQIALALEFFD
jgi:hypothetical protein